MKVSKSIEIIYNSRNILSKRLMKPLCFSFIHSYWNYANIAWGSTNKSNLISLYVKDRFAHTKPLFKHAKALTLCETNQFQILSLILSVETEIYTLNPPSKYSLRTDNLLSIPLKPTKFGQFSIPFRGPYL